jgi:hypothetical protein
MGGLLKLQGSGQLHALAGLPSMRQVELVASLAAVPAKVVPAAEVREVHCEQRLPLRTSVALIRGLVCRA